MRTSDALAVMENILGSHCNGSSATAVIAVGMAMPDPVPDATPAPASTTSTSWRRPCWETATPLALCPLLPEWPECLKLAPVVTWAESQGAQRSLPGGTAQRPSGRPLALPANRLTRIQRTVNIQSTYSQHTVNIQSTYSQHTANISRFHTYFQRKRAAGSKSN